MQKSICIFTLYLFMFALNLFLHRFRNELTHSLTNGNHFSSLVLNPIFDIVKDAFCIPSDKYTDNLT